MRKILPPSNPKTFRRSAILTGASLGTLTAIALSFQNCAAFRLESSTRPQNSVGRIIADGPSSGLSSGLSSGPFSGPSSGPRSELPSDQPSGR